MNLKTSAVLLSALILAACAPKKEYLDGYRAGYMNAKRHCESGKIDK